MSRPKYTRERYLADLAALDLKHRDAPALRRLLDEAVTQGAELGVPVPDGRAAPISRIVARALPTPPRPTLIGVGTGEPPSAPVTARVLAAVGLGLRPSGRLR